jgi:phosphoribosylformylglycinamidine synthase
VTGGNVSFYNQTGTTPILPTPVVGVLGVIEDVATRVPSGFRTDAALVYLLGDTRDDFGGSEWADCLHGFLGGRPPALDFVRERLLADVLIACARDGLIDSARALVEGGLAQALVASALRGDCGVRIELPVDLDPFVALFAESAGRAVVSVLRGHEARFSEMCATHGLPAARIGVLDVLTPSVEVEGQFSISLRELRAAWTRPLPSHFE